MVEQLFCKQRVGCSNHPAGSKFEMKSILKIFQNFLKFFYEKKVFFSEKNGKILVKKILGKYEIFCEGFLESGGYVNALWRKFLRKLPKDFQPRRVLLLGLGGGGVVKEIFKNFPNCYLAAVEYDDQMVKIAKETFLKNINLKSCQIFTMDAALFVKKPQKPFDLILIDIFKGSTPSPLLKSDEFLESVKLLLAKNGYLLVNFFRHLNEFLPFFEKFFYLYKKTKFWFNQLAIFKNFPLKNFLNKEQSLAFLSSKVRNSKRMKIVGEEGIYGIQRDFLFFYVEKYVSFLEPKIEKGNKPKIVIWEPLNSPCIFSKWLKFPFVFFPKKIGIFHLKEENYWKEWSLNCQRNRKKFLTKGNYEIFKTDLQNFLFFYEKSGQLEFFFRFFIKKLLNFYSKTQRENVNFLLAKDKKKEEILAGLAFVDFLDISLSKYLISFLNKSARKTPAGIGLIDFWFKHCLLKKISFLDFGVLWTWGNPKSWKGFSNFKRQFNLYEITFSKVYFKILI